MLHKIITLNNGKLEHLMPGSLCGAQQRPNCTHNGGTSRLGWKHVAATRGTAARPAPLFARRGHVQSTHGRHPARGTGGKCA